MENTELQRKKEFYRTNRSLLTKEIVQNIEQIEEKRLDEINDIIKQIM